VEKAEKAVASFDAYKDGRVHWDEFKAAVDKAAEPVDSRVQPISASLMLYFVGEGIKIPVMPLFMKSLALSPADMGLANSCGSLAKLAANVPAATLVARVGRRPLLVGGTALEAVAMLGMATSTTMHSMAGCIALAGVGGACMITGATNYLADLSTPRNRARTNMPLQMTALLGISIGPVVGGFGAASYGAAAPFYAISGMLAASTVALALTCPETLRPPAGGGGAASAGAPNAQLGLVEQWRVLGSKPELQALFACNYAVGVREGGMAVTSFLFMYDTLQLSPQCVGFYMMSVVGSMLVCTRPAAWLSDRYADDRRMMMVPAYCTPPLVLAAQSMCTTLEPFWALGIVGACGSAGQMATAGPFIMSAAPTQMRSQAFALSTMCQDVGRICGATALGAISSSVGVVAGMQVSAGVGVAAAAFFAARSARYI